METPKSLLEATRKFSTPLAAHNYLTKLRWPDGVIPCPVCGSEDHYFLTKQLRWKCKLCKRQFSVKVGTIFEDSPLGLDKWLTAVWLISSAKNGTSSSEIARSLEVTQKTAWFMLHRIRLAVKNGTFEKLGEEFGAQVEADEAYFGGDPKNMHAHVHEAKNIRRGRGTHKTAVVGLLESGGDVRTQIIFQPSSKELHSAVRRHVAKGSTLYTDSWHGYCGLNAAYAHFVINHAQAYVEGLVHTNGLENFWSLMKRTLRGAYVSVEPFHLHAYLDEQMFRFNERRGTDGSGFDLVGSQVAGKRLTYKKLIGKELAAG